MFPLKFISLNIFHDKDTHTHTKEACCPGNLLFMHPPPVPFHRPDSTKLSKLTIFSLNCITT